MRIRHPRSLDGDPPGIAIDVRELPCSYHSDTDSDTDED